MQKAEKERLLLGLALGQLALRYFRDVIVIFEQDAFLYTFDVVTVHIMTRTEITQATACSRISTLALARSRTDLKSIYYRLYVVG